MCLSLNRVTVGSACWVWSGVETTCYLLFHSYYLHTIRTLYAFNLSSFEQEKLEVEIAVRGNRKWCDQSLTHGRSLVLIGFSHSIDDSELRSGLGTISLRFSITLLKSVRTLNITKTTLLCICN